MITTNLQDFLFDSPVRHTGGGGGGGTSQARAIGNNRMLYISNSDFSGFH